VVVTFAVIAVILVAPHVGPIFPRIDSNFNASVPTPGFVWIYVAVFASFVASGVAAVIYEGVVTARYGRTLGKAWLHIRPTRIDGIPLGWCLWDENQQCLHDKAIGTLVVNDVSFVARSYGPATQAPAGNAWPTASGWWQASDGNWYPPPHP
jgi:uncharacterized RDD family membrane protein YckC